MDMDMDIDPSKITPVKITTLQEALYIAQVINELEGHKLLNRAALIDLIEFLKSVTIPNPNRL